MEIGVSIAIATGSALLALLLGQGYFYNLVKKNERRARRREIVILLSLCADLIYQSVRDGTLVAKWKNPANAGFDDVAKEYWEKGVKALSLFEVREQLVAEWVEIELHAGLLGFFRFLDDSGSGRRGEIAQQTLEGYLADGRSSEEVSDYGPPRASMLAEWAELRSIGPIYGAMDTAGDKSRNHIVIPNSDVELPDRLSPVHNLAPQGHRLRGRWSAKRLESFYRRLRRKHTKEWQRKAKGR